MLSSYSYMNQHTDHYFITEIRNGNTKAFAALVDSYKNMVFTLAVQLLKHHEDAEEASQDTFVKVFKSIGSFKQDAKLSTWVYRIAYNTCLDKLKAQKRRREVELENALTEKDTQTIDNAYELLVKSEQSELIKQCVHHLPNDEGFLMTLYYFEELSLDEISKITNLTTNHVKVKLYRSRKKLLTIMKEKLEPETIASYERR